jgi:hypothetical protein
MHARSNLRPRSARLFSSLKTSANHAQLSAKAPAVGPRDHHVALVERGEKGFLVSHRLSFVLIRASFALIRALCASIQRSISLFLASLSPPRLGARLEWASTRHVSCDPQVAQLHGIMDTRTSTNISTTMQLVGSHSCWQINPSPLAHLLHFSSSYSVSGTAWLVELDKY